MMKRTALLTLAAMGLLASTAYEPGVPLAGIVIYGDTMAGVAAAKQAAAHAPQQTVTLVVPGTSTQLGGLGTVGGQNFYDLRPWNGENPQQGTFGEWYGKHGQFYSTDALARQMQEELRQYPNLSIVWNADIEKVDAEAGRITALQLREVAKEPGSGQMRFGDNARTVRGAVFIDASDDGRLYRLSGGAATTGRYDWPAAKLDADEVGKDGKARQQAATLMIKIKGIDWPGSGEIDSVRFGVDASTGVRYLQGGRKIIAGETAVKAFNRAHAAQGFMIKPFNIAQNGPGSEDYWVNMLLVFNVDGRAHEKDRGTDRFPRDMRADYQTVDQAYQAAVRMVQSPDFLSALRAFPHFDKVTVSGVADHLYLRETIHGPRNRHAIANGTENTNYALTSHHTLTAGKGPQDGGDSANYATRIGLAFYQSDINAYKPTDMFTPDFNLIWPVTYALRSDLQGQVANHPVYLPYAALTAPHAVNLLVPGYATSVPSLAWSEVRVLPNLTVLGDAAGVAAAYAVNNGKKPLQLNASDIANLQTLLRHAGARLDK